MEMWVRILNLPFGWMNERRGARAAGLIGKVIKLDVDSDGNASGPFLRVNNAVIGGIAIDVERLKGIQEQNSEEDLRTFVDGYLGSLQQNYELAKECLDDGNLAARGWLPPPVASAYAASKALVNAYSRLLARRQPSLVVCCVNPGFVRTGMSYGMGLVSAEAGAKPPVVLALRDEPGDSGLNFELFDFHTCVVKKQKKHD
ncbi:uncharacterized protein LOC101775591 [Setaria italica]|uniref:uncharacterized protein LOC101775591 n=1 Tax=Setaria italica TaxID=4555 RepID=UPI00035124AB|nr:uncharacterized protein LOC101775591 [Setaria italica]